MTEIIVVADGEATNEASVIWRERVRPRELDSGHFAAQLIERLGWALSDAEEMEQGRAEGASSPEGRPRARPG